MIYDQSGRWKMHEIQHLEAARKRKNFHPASGGDVSMNDRRGECKTRRYDGKPHQK
jgi:hypothetical protein